MRLAFVVAFALASACGGPSRCGELVYDRDADACVCPPGTEARSEEGVCVLPDGGTIPWDAGPRDGGTDAADATTDGAVDATLDAFDASPDAFDASPDTFDSGTDGFIPDAPATDGDFCAECVLVPLTEFTPDQSLNGISDDGSLIYVVGGGGEIATASDLMGPWTTEVGGGELRAIAHGDGTFVAVGFQGGGLGHQMVRRNDGSGWELIEPASPLTGRRFHDVRWSASLSLFVVAGDNGEIQTSANATAGSWAVQSTPTTVPLLAIAASTDESVVVAVGGRRGAGSALVRSTNVIAWTDATPPGLVANDVLVDAEWDETRGVFVVLGQNADGGGSGMMWEGSADATSWSAITSFPADVFAFEFAVTTTGTWLVSGNRGVGENTILFSEDRGETWDEFSTVELQRTVSFVRDRWVFGDANGTLSFASCECEATSLPF